MDLRHNARLRSLQIELDGFSEGTRPVTHMLSTISSAHMDEVGFEIDARDIGLLGWNEIDAALQHSSFSKLRKVEVRVIRWRDLVMGWDPNDLLLIMDVIPQCHARGILRIREVVRQYFSPSSFEGLAIDLDMHRFILYDNFVDVGAKFQSYGYTHGCQRHL